ncbi:MAG: hypothetical protein KY460_06015 [Actinobacteria bacterium]|nr:hypothetical protein [Actinomycetota bacterium]
MQTNKTAALRSIRSGLIALLSLALLAALALPATAHGRHARVQREDVLTQNETGVYARNGARLHRNRYSFTVRWKVRTPRPGTYAYPSPDQIPPGAPPHPPVEPGRPEVFTLWAFVFNYPKRCTDACDFDDIGPDTAAQGGIYQLDGTVAYGRRITMRGKIRLGQQPATGATIRCATGTATTILRCAPAVSVPSRRRTRCWSSRRTQAPCRCGSGSHGSCAGGR